MFVSVYATTPWRTTSTSLNAGSLVNLLSMVLPTSRSDVNSHEELIWLQSEGIITGRLCCEVRVVFRFEINIVHPGDRM
jgi:hypothetical protein